MGSVSAAVDMRMVQCLREALPLTRFVAAGTVMDDTVAQVEDYFDRIVAIERSEAQWKASKARFSQSSNVDVVLGESASALAQMQQEMAGEPTLFWLDVDWCIAANTDGNQRQCPLLEELQAIANLGTSSVVLIDDARLFLAPPPEPHDISGWPSFEEVLFALRQLSDKHELMVVNDVIAFYPESIADAVKGHARKHGVDWRSAALSPGQQSDVTQVIKEQQKVIEEQKSLLDKQREELLQKREMSAVYFMFEAGLRPFFGLVRPVFRLLQPKLGRLNQHPPREVRLPEHYYDATESRDICPTISIVTPSFNQARFIERTMRSVIDQSYPKLDYFVQDGASNDHTVTIIESLAESLAGWESCSDSGQSQAINRGFSRTTGEIMAWLNSDDILLPGALAYVADFFVRHPDVDVVYGHRLLIDEDDNHIGDWMLPEHDNAVLSWADFIPQETMFWRRSIWEKVGGAIDESFQFAMDWDLLVRFREAGARFARVPRFLGGFRVHAEQKTSVAISETGIAEMNRIRMRTLGRIPMKSEIQKAMLSYLLRHVAVDMAWRVKRKFAFR
ncbi:MAG: glycosyltransferase family 2 protein [Sedimenticolaceae bacterium]